MAVLVVADNDNAHLRDGTHKTVTAALKLSSDVDVLILGKGAKAVADAAAKITGVRKVLLAESDALGHGVAEAQADAVLALAGGLYLQLRIVAVHRRTSMAVLVFALALACGATMVWKDRNQSAPYLAALYPPSWRFAQPVPVAQWMQEAGGLRQRLDARLQTDEEDEAPDGDEDEEE